MREPENCPEHCPITGLPFQYNSIHGCVFGSQGKRFHGIDGSVNAVTAHHPFTQDEIIYLRNKLDTAPTCSEPNFGWYVVHADRGIPEDFTKPRFDIFCLKLF